MQYVTINGTDYLHIQSLAEALNVSTATIYVERHDNSPL